MKKDTGRKTFKMPWNDVHILLQATDHTSTNLSRLYNKVTGHYSCNTNSSVPNVQYLHDLHDSMDTEQCHSLL